jgi:hypothetical protein
MKYLEERAVLEVRHQLKMLALDARILWTKMRIFWCDVQIAFYS